MPLLYPETQNWPYFVVEAPSKLQNFYYFFWKVTYATINSPFITATANGSSEFPLAWKFIANSYPHTLISALAFCDRLNIAVQAWLPRQGHHFMSEIVWGVVMNCDLVVKLKIAKIFPWCVSWWFTKIYARKHFPLYSIRTSKPSHLGKLLPVIV